MKFKVKATKLGYLNHIRYKEGQVFFLDESQMVKKSAVKDEAVLAKRKVVKSESGEFILPLWVELVEEDYEPKAPIKKSPKELSANKEVI